MSTIDWLHEFIGSVVVGDLADGYQVIGTLCAAGPQHVGFSDADLHDHRESTTPRDVYLIETRKFGIRVNRKRVDIPRQLLMAISLLSDVAE